MRNIYKKSITLIILFILLTNIVLPTVYAVGETENIEFKDQYLKQQILENNDADGDGEITKQEIEQIEYLNLNYTDWNENTLQSLEDLAYLTNLKYLDLYNYNANAALDLSILTNIETLESLYIAGNEVSVSTISNIVTNLPNLTMLGIESYNAEIDVAQIVKLKPDLETLNISATKFENLSALSGFSKLKSLYIYDGSDNSDIDNLINDIKGLNIENLHVGCTIEVNLGQITEGETVTKTFAEISPVLEYIYDNNNVLYSPESYLECGDEQITIDNTAKTVQIEAIKQGTQSIFLYTQNSAFTGNINITWKTILQGDSETEINIPDENLKSILLEEYDIDNNGKITELDLKQIEELRLDDWDRPVTNLEGIQYMTNLKYFNINCSNTDGVDISLLSELKQLRGLYIYGNKIADISFLLDFENLESASLYGNPINPEDTQNASVLSTLKQKGVEVYLSEYDNSPIIEFVNKELKQDLLKNFNNDLNGDGEISEYEMKQVTTIYNMRGKLDDLKYATNLIYLYYTVDATNVDISTIFSLKSLENLSINGYVYDENGNPTNQTIDLTKILELTNLKELSINTNLDVTYNELPKSLTALRISTSTEIDMAKYTYLSNLSRLSISARKINNIEEISKLQNLTELSLTQSTYYISNGEDNEPKANKLDLSKLETLTKIISLDVSGDWQNISSLKKLTNLKNLRISNNGSLDIDIEDMMTTLNNLNVETLSVCGYYGVDIGTMTLNSNQSDIKIKDLCAITKAIYTNGNKLYIENPQWKINDESLGDKDYVSIDTSSVGKHYLSLRLTTYDQNFSGTILITYNVIEDGDKTTEINIPDSNLKQALLDDYDIDNNGKITEYDMINISEIDIESKNIESIEGLQNLKNVRMIYIPYNKITDLTPIVSLERLQYVDCSSNYIQNIDCLKNAKVPLNVFHLNDNYIELSKGSSNYNLLKNAYIEEMKKDEYSVNFIENEEILEQIDNYIIYSQHYDSFANRTKEVKMESALKQKLIELGVDKDNNNVITQEELYRISEDMYELDLSGLGITDLSPFKYINHLESINLSNNDITDISALEHTKYVNIDLSGNKISDISVLKDMYDLYYINLSNNNISNVKVLADMPYIKYNYTIYVYMDYMGVDENFYTCRIDLSSNYIDVSEANNKKAIDAVDTEKNVLILDNQKEKTTLRGDVNGDGKVTLLDYGLVLAHVKRTKLLAGDMLERADVNGDGKVTLLDYGLILAHVKRTKLLF